MQLSKAIIEGSDLTTLIDSFQKNLNAYNKVLFKSGKSFILVFEGHYTMDIADKLMVTMIFDFSSEGKCDVDIVSGGGEDRFLNVLWDPEQTRNAKIVKTLRDICDGKKWKLSEVIKK